MIEFTHFDIKEEINNQIVLQFGTIIDGLPHWQEFVLISNTDDANQQKLEYHNRNHLIKMLMHIYLNTNIGGNRAVLHSADDSLTLEFNSHMEGSIDKFSIELSDETEVFGIYKKDIDSKEKILIILRKLLPRDMSVEERLPNIVGYVGDIPDDLKRNH